VNAGFTEKKKHAMKHKCPICKKATDSTFDAEFPFCSEDCRLSDLGNWATEKYVVSEPIFNEDDLVDSDAKTITLDLDNPNEADH
jgi:endogenous inhibitor of DNA gyrase (YacG/DUF329 family)